MSLRSLSPSEDLNVNDLAYTKQENMNNAMFPTSLSFTGSYTIDNAVLASFYPVTTTPTLTGNSELVTF